MRSKSAAKVTFTSQITIVAPTYVQNPSTTKRGATHSASASIATAITSAAREVADAVDVKAICCFTHSGTTARLASRERPSAPVIALTPFRKTARQLTMCWGLHCVVSESVERFKMAVISAARAAKALDIAQDDDRIAVTAGVPFNKPGTTNILRIAPVDEKAIYEGEPGGGY